MEREFIAHHIKEDDSELEHLIASMLPKKYLKKYLKHSTEHWRIPEAFKALKDVFRSTRRLQDTRLRRARGLVRPGTAGLLIDGIF